MASTSDDVPRTPLHQPSDHSSSSPLVSSPNSANEGAATLSMLSPSNPQDKNAPSTPTPITSSPMETHDSQQETSFTSLHSTPQSLLGVPQTPISLFASSPTYVSPSLPTPAFKHNNVTPQSQSQSHVGSLSSTPLRPEEQSRYLMSSSPIPAPAGPEKMAETVGEMGCQLEFTTRSVSSSSHGVSVPSPRDGAHDCDEVKHEVVDYRDGELYDHSVDDSSPMSQGFHLLDESDDGEEVGCVEFDGSVAEYEEAAYAGSSPLMDRGEKGSFNILSEDQEEHNGNTSSMMEQQAAPENASYISSSSPYNSYVYTHDDIEGITNLPGKTLSHRPHDLHSIFSGDREVTSEEVQHLNTRRQELEAEVQDELLQAEEASEKAAAMAVESCPSLEELKEQGVAVPLAEGVAVVDPEKLEELLGSNAEPEDEAMDQERTSTPSDFSPSMDYVSPTDLERTSTPTDYNPFLDYISPTDLTEFPSSRFLPSTPTPMPQPQTLRRRVSTSTGSRMPSSSHSPNTKLDSEANTTDQLAEQRRIQFTSPSAVQETPFKKTLNYFKQYRGKENSPSKSRRNASLPEEIAEMAKEAGLRVETDDIDEKKRVGMDGGVGKVDGGKEDVEEEELEKYREMDLAPLDTVMEGELAGDLIMMGPPTPARVRDWMNEDGKRMGARDVMAGSGVVDDDEEEDDDDQFIDSVSTPSKNGVKPQREDAEQRDQHPTPSPEPKARETHSLFCPETNPQDSPSKKQLILYQERPVFINVIGMLPAAMFWTMAVPVAVLSNKAYDKVVEKLSGLKL
ncbi:hypothetical protein CC80DRAFT_555686 [Byssothecium circinans]|uniref:Uncharacterized protein n=1 Tax=Byssothecium circinans TaxID=147558 RepID=A0A6A5T9W7_9PLEO|nr:hypothetical protein CC80DRAFT_555686 [Byssothecium circinans]